MVDRLDGMLVHLKHNTTFLCRRSCYSLTYVLVSTVLIIGAGGGHNMGSGIFGVSGRQTRPDGREGTVNLSCFWSFVT